MRRALGVGKGGSPRLAEASVVRRVWTSGGALVEKWGGECGEVGGGCGEVAVICGYSDNELWIAGDERSETGAGTVDGGEKRVL